VKTAGDGRVIVYCRANEADSDKAAALRKSGVEVFGIAVGRMGKPAPTFVLQDLAQRGVTHLVVDAGPTLGQSLIDQGLADRIWVIHSPKTIQAPDAPSAPLAPYPQVASLDLRGDRLVEMLNPHSDVFFSSTPSPDLNLAREMVS
jgi:riboflavin biosynthesis pyrimidine reductase